MKPLLTLSGTFFLLSMILLTSCVKEHEVMTRTYETQALTGEAYLNGYVTSEIMFHHVSVDEGWGTVEGWIIDNKGNLTTYTLDELPFELEDETVPVDLAQRVLSSGTVKKVSIDLDAMVESYKKVKNIDRTKLSLDRDKPTDRYTNYLIAYDLFYPDSECSTGSCPGVEPSSTLISQYILKAEGFINGENTSIQAKQVASWMEELKSGF